MNQFDMFSPKPANEKTVNIENGQYIYIPNFYNTSQADIYFDLLLNTIKWQQESVNMYGKQILFPRLTAWYGDNDKSYRFSGITLKPLPWSKELLEIKKRIELTSKVSFNSVLLNRYRDGNDSISWHADDEKELGENPVIASVNFGAARKFRLRHMDSMEKIEIKLEHGSLLIMKGELQHFWQHQIPKTKKKIAQRINLTFRVIKGADALN